jgi:hypothetical protein
MVIGVLAAIGGLVARAGEATGQRAGLKPGSAPGSRPPDRLPPLPRPDCLAACRTTGGDRPWNLEPA